MKMKEIWSFSNERSRVSKRFGIFLLTVATSLVSCDNLLEIDPPKENIDSEVVFSSDLTAVSAMTGIYHDLISQGFASGTDQSIVALTGMSSDEFIFNYDYWQNLELQEFNRNDILSNNNYVRSLWVSLYKSIYASNAMMEGLSNSTSISESIREQLRGEALFVRAFCHFYAVNLFGDIPLVISTDYEINSKIFRSPTLIVYEQVLKDLVEAKSLLAEEYFSSLNLKATDRVRVNKYVAAALLARVYLYKGDWVNSEAEATSLLNNTALYGLSSDINNVFLASTASNINKEVIWQLMPVGIAQNINTNEGNVFIIDDGSSTSYKFTLADSLRASFEPGDDRQIKWIGSFDNGSTILFFPYKYKIKYGTPLTEYSMVLRVAEQYLIRAEARAEQGDIQGAQNDINVIRNRALLSNTTANDLDSLLFVIEQERRVELFAEWGHRWFDLKRWNRANIIIEPIKDANWQTADVLYPLPQSELNRNSNLTPQNPGY